jgi:FixJ family two-component response regulator
MVSTFPMDDEQAIVFVVDDDQSIRESVQFLFRSVDLTVRSYKSAREFLQDDRPDAPGCLVLDIRLPGLSGLDFQSELARLNLAYPIIFLSGHGDIPMAVRAIQAGAVAFLTKPFQDQELLDAVQKAIGADRDRRRAAKMLEELRRRFDTLSGREREIFSLVVTGIPNKQIAATLDVSEVTVKVHRGNVMRKMHAKTFADLIRMADKLSTESLRPTS